MFFLQLVTEMTAGNNRCARSETISEHVLSDSGFDSSHCHIVGIMPTCMLDVN